MSDGLPEEQGPDLKTLHKLIRLMHRYGLTLGNWAYDKLSGHGHSDHSTELGQGSESAGVWSGSSGEEPVADAGQWSGADDGGDWGRQEDSGGWSGADTGGDWSGGDSGGGDSGGGGGDW